MKKTITYISIILCGWACTYDFPDTDILPESGTADFSKFVCIGDNYTAGFMDGALYTDGQVNSIGSLFAGQIEEIMLSPFIQADIHSENGYNPIFSDSLNTYGRIIYRYPMISSEEPVMIKLPGETPGTYTGDKDLLTDFSIPQIKSYQIEQPQLSANPYFNRIAANPGTSTLLQQISDSSPTFFLFWMGMYDALHYAISGALGDADPPSDPALLNENDITPEDLFENSVRSVISTLLSNPITKGIVVNLPSFSDLPFFYYYQYDFIRLQNSQLGTARQKYFTFNQSVTIHNQIPDVEDRPYIDFNDNGFSLYPQPLLVYDDSLVDALDIYGDPLPKIRHLRPGEMVLLTLPFEEVSSGLGWLDPLTKDYYLNLNDIQVLEEAIGKLNDVLEEVVLDYPDRLVMVDMNTPIADLATTGRMDSWGIPENFDIVFIDGIPLKADLSMNSIFSLDGLHFNPRGNAYVTNHIINSVNKQFGSDIPVLKVNMFMGNTIQNNF